MTLRNRSLNFRRFTTSIAFGVLLSAASVAFGQSPGVYPPGSKPYGLSYGEWSARWWQWVLSIPPAKNPILDGLQGQPPHGNHCAEGQSDPVWFLPGTFGGAAFRNCTVPTGVSLFFPIANIVFGAGAGDCQTPGTAPDPCASYMFHGLTGVPALQAAAADAEDNAGSLEASIDGNPVPNPTAFRAASPVFSYWLTSDSLLNSLFGFRDPAGLYTPVVSDGYWVMLTPLSEGAHTLHFKTVSPDGSFVVEVTYILSVEDVERAGAPTIILSPISLHAGDVAVLPVALSSPAANSEIITLTSSNPSVLSLSTATVASTANVLIPAGATSAGLRVAAGSPGTVTITATAYGFAPVSIQVVVAPK